MGGSTLRGNDATELTGKTVTVLGLVFPIKFSEKFRLQPEIQIAQKGARTGSYYSYEDEAGRFATTYVEVPLVFQYLINLNDGAVNLFVEAGPSVGYWLRAKQKGIDFIHERYEFNSDIDNRLDVAVITGAGIKFIFKKSEFFMGPRITTSVLSIKDDLNQRNFVVTFSGGYTYFFNSSAE